MCRNDDDCPSGETCLTTGGGGNFCENIGMVDSPAMVEDDEVVMVTVTPMPVMMDDVSPTPKPSVERVKRPSISPLAVGGSVSGQRCRDVRDCVSGLFCVKREGRAFGACRVCRNDGDCPAGESCLFTGGGGNFCQKTREQR